MATTADFRNGLCIEFNGDIYSIVEFQHVKPGKGGAFVRTRLRNLKDGRVIPNTFNAGVKITVVRIERRPHQYIYSDAEFYHFMNAENFEQISIEEKMLDAPDLLKEGQTVDIIFHADTETPLTCEMPAYVTLEITDTGAGDKGNTATNAMKDAVLETGATIKVPLFINTGDKVKVDTRSHEYSERVK